MHVDAVGDVAVLEVPPHRHPHRPAALVVLRRIAPGPGPGAPPPASAGAAVDRGAEEAAAALDAHAMGVVGGDAAQEDLRHGGGGGADPRRRSRFCWRVLEKPFSDFRFCHAGTK